MPTQIHRLTTSPVDLLAASDIDGNALSLAVGKTYQCRFVGLQIQAICKVLEAATGTQVAASDDALPIRIYEDLIVAPISGQSVFVWCEDSGTLVINDVP